MRLFVKLTILTLIAALAGPFFIHGPDGRPLVTGADIKRHWRAFVRDLRGSGGGDTIPVHRWQNADGVWHYSDEHGAAAGSEVIHIDPNVNTLPAIKAPPPQAPAGRAPPALPATPSLPSPLTVSPGKVRQLIDDAKGVQEQLDERADEIDETIKRNQ